MSPGITEEVSGVAKAVAGGLSPGLLAVVVLNIIVLSGVGYLIIKSAESRTAQTMQVMTLLERCLSDKGDRSTDTGPN